MITFKNWSFLLILFFSFFNLQAKAQYFLRPGQPCATGDKIQLDTFFYSADKAFPFDRCFILSFQLPGSHALKSFSIAPVDKNGNKNIRRRDYHAFRKSGRIPFKERNLYIPYHSFRDPKIPFTLQFTDIRAVAQGNHTQFYLRMPPLDPDRSYRLYLKMRDNASLDKMGALESALREASTNLDIRTDNIADAQEAYKKIMAIRAKDLIPGEPFSFHSLAAALADNAGKVLLKNDSSQELKYFTATYVRYKVSVTREYRFFIAAAGAVPGNPLTELDTSRYVSFSSETFLASASVPLLLAEMRNQHRHDINGSIIDYQAAGNYDIHVATIDKTYRDEKKFKDDVVTEYLLAEVQLGVPVPATPNGPIHIINIRGAVTAEIPGQPSPFTTFSSISTPGVEDCKKAALLNKEPGKRYKDIFGNNSPHAGIFTRQYRFFIAPQWDGVPALSAITALPSIQYLKVTSTPILSFVPIQLILAKMREQNIHDISNRTIPYNANGNYSIYVLTIDQITPNNSTLSDTGNLYKLADITLQEVTKDLLGNPVDSIRLIAINSSSSCSNDVFNGFSKIVKQKADIETLASRAFDCFKSPNETIKLAMDAAVACPCDSGGIKDQAQKDDLLRSISLLYFPQDSTMQSILSGFVSFKDPFASTKEEELDGRMANLKISVTQLRAVKEFLLKIRVRMTAANQTDINNQVSCINALEVRLTIIAKNMKQLSESIAARTTFYEKYFAPSVASDLGNASTSVMDFMSAAKFRIVPDFGLIGIFKSSKLGFQDLTPYLGFNISFRSIDKNISMKFVRYKTWRHRFSFLGGVTLRSLKIEGKREDFFNNYNLITGIGFRLTNSLKITGGTVWFKTINQNPTITTTPLGFSPFVGLSLDLELQNLFGGIAKLFQ